MAVPTEAEIQSAAEQLGLTDANGRYPSRDRSRIAKAVQIAQQDQAVDADPSNGTTAQQLAEFRNELAANGLQETEIVGPLLDEVARHLLQSQGLRLAPREETTPS